MKFIFNEILLKTVLEYIERDVSNYTLLDYIEIIMKIV